MEAHASTRWVYAERTKVVAEIFAIIVAGLWGLKLYNETEVPAQEKRASVQSKLQWTKKSAHDCLAEYTVTFKNVGKTAIDLGSPRLRVWIADDPKPTAAVKYFDVHPLMSRNADLTQALNEYKLEREFSDHYAPDVSDEVTMTVRVQRNPDGPSRIALFRIDFPEKDPQAPEKDPQAPRFLDWRWDYVCGDSFTPPVKRKRSAH